MTNKNKRNIRKIYFFFTLSVTSLVAVMVFGTQLIRNNVYFSEEYISQTFDYTRLALKGNEEPGFLANILDTLDSTSVASSNNSAKSVPVLVYHGALDKPDGFNVTKNQFEEQMRALKKDGWQTVSILDFRDYMYGNKTLPDKSFLLTFDDGRKDSFYPVDPVLKVLNFRAVMFAITKHAFEEKSGYYLSAAEYELMKNTGRWDIESHGYDDHGFHAVSRNPEQEPGHFLSNLFYIAEEDRFETEAEHAERVRLDLGRSKRDIEKNLDLTPISFAYPFGDYGDQTKNYAEAKEIVPGLISEVYSLGFYQVPPHLGSIFNVPGAENNALIKRIYIDPAWSGKDLVHLLNTGKAKTIPYDSRYDYENSRWVSNWGVMVEEKGSLTISANPTGTGGQAFLDGTLPWQDYHFTAELSQQKEGSAALMFRYQDDLNFALCNYTGEIVRLESSIDGKREIIDSNPHPLSLSVEQELSVRVKGKDAECLSGDQVIVSGRLPSELYLGGIGVKTWNESMNNALLKVSHVSVAEF